MTVFQIIANAADLNIAKRDGRVIRSTHRHTDTTNRYYHYDYSALISGQVPAEGTPPLGWEGGAHAGRSAAAASFSRLRALPQQVPHRPARFNQNTNTMWTAHRTERAFSYFPETFGLSDIFPAGEKWVFVCFSGDLRDGGNVLNCFCA